MGDAEQAMSLYQRALVGCEKNLGKDHPLTLTTVSNLALLYKSNQDYAAAEPLLKRVLATREKTLGADHPDTLVDAPTIWRDCISRWETIRPPNCCTGERWPDFRRPWVQIIHLRSRTPMVWPHFTGA